MGHHPMMLLCTLSIDAHYYMMYGHTVLVRLSSIHSTGSAPSLRSLVKDMLGITSSDYSEPQSNRNSWRL